MGNSWDMAKTLADKVASQNGVFVRLASDGDKVVGAFCGEPFAREVFWNGERYEVYDAANTAHSDKRAGLRVMINFFVPAENSMKVIEGGSGWFKDVVKVREKYGLENTLFEIERHGESGSTKTTYTILPDAKITEEMKAKIAAIELHDLERVANGQGENGESRPASSGASPKTGPIDARVAGEMVARLKSLPRSDLDAFMAKMGVKRVRDLKASDETAARALLDQLEAKATPAQTDAIDPFA